MLEFILWSFVAYMVLGLSLSLVMIILSVITDLVDEFKIFIRSIPGDIAKIRRCFLWLLGRRISETKVNPQGPSEHDA